MWGHIRPRRKLQWISFHKTFIFLNAISHFTIYGQIPDISPEYNNDEFIPTFGPLGGNQFGPNVGGGRLSRSFSRNGVEYSPVGGGGNFLPLAKLAYFFGNVIWKYLIGFGGGGDLQSSFSALFDWSRNMPAIDIVNTFLDNEDDLPILSDLQNACPRSEFFYGTNPSHREASMKIMRLLMEQSSPEDAIL